MVLKKAHIATLPSIQEPLLSLIPHRSLLLANLNRKLVRKFRVVATGKKKSPKKWNKFKDVLTQIEVGEFQRNTHMMRPLWPTRWVMHLPAVDALTHYAATLEFGRP